MDMGIHVWIIDHNRSQTRLIRDLLADMGVSGQVDTLTLRPGISFLDISSADILIGEMSLAGQLTKASTKGLFLHKDHIPVILIKGSDSPPESLGDLDSGLSLIVSRPIDPALFCQSYNQAVKLRQYQKHIWHQKENLDERMMDLAKSEKQFKSIFESIQEGFYRSGADGCLVLANPVTVKMFGYDTFDQMKGMKMTGLYRNPEERERVMAKLYEKGSVSAYEIEIKKRDGDFGHVLVNARIRYGAKGEVLGAEGTLVDITEKKQLEKELAQSQKLESIGQLAAGIAHEINTPIQYVGDNVRFLQDSFEELLSIFHTSWEFIKGLPADQVPEDLVEKKEDADIDFLSQEVPAAISQSLEGVSRVRRIVRSMKEFSHPGGEGHELTDINQGLENTAMVSKSEWKYVAELVLDLEPGLPKVYCNPGEINQVFLNLIINASHAVEEAMTLVKPEKGSIYIKTRDAQEEIEILVRDSGIGIDESSQLRVFDPFFTTKKVGRGTGQGLAISRSVVVEKHRGKIWFETRVGKGTTFFIRLPKPEGENMDE